LLNRISEKLFYLIRVSGISSYPVAGLGIGGEFWAAEEEGVDLIEADAVEVDPFDCHIETLGLEFFFDAKDFTPRVSLFRVSHFKREGHEFDLGFLDVLREPGGGAQSTRTLISLPNAVGDNREGAKSNKDGSL